MKSTQIITHHSKPTKLEKLFESASCRSLPRPIYCLKIHATDGLLAGGKCLGKSHCERCVIQAMTPLLIGKNALDIEPIWLSSYNTSEIRDSAELSINAIMRY